MGWIRCEYPRMTSMRLGYNLEHIFGKVFMTFGELLVLLQFAFLSHCQHLITRSSFTFPWQKLGCCSLHVTGKLSQQMSDQACDFLALNSVSDQI